MEFWSNHADTITLLVLLAGLAWRGSERITRLEAGITLLESKIESLQRELIEAKERTTRNFDRLHERLDQQQRKDD